MRFCWVEQGANDGDARDDKEGSEELYDGTEWWGHVFIRV
jgi:hypothetical protein